MKKITIGIPNVLDAKRISELAQETFLDAHGHSAPSDIIKSYLNRNFTELTLKEELANTNNIYRIIEVDEKLAGYSKIVPNQDNENLPNPEITKLERLYVKKEFYGFGLAQRLLNQNIQIAQTHHQKSIWLFVWTENHRAIGFYKKMGFEIAGSYDFELSPTHSNPNHLMVLNA